MYFRSDHRGCCGGLAALAVAVTLSGCANLDLDASGTWFQKPLDMVGRESGYTYSELQESNKLRPITPNELVDTNGACPPPPASAQPLPPQPQPVAANPNGAPMAAPVEPAPSSLLGGGIALGMSECSVVYRAGQPTAVQLGKNPNGDRTAQLTFAGGPHPGIYRFERGRLMEMDSVEVPTPPAPEPKKVAKKKPVKPAKKPPNDQS